MVTIDHFGNGLELNINGVSSTLRGQVNITDNEMENIFDWQFQNWLDLINNPRHSTTTVDDSVEVIGLIEKCYQNRQSLQHDWETFKMSTTKV